MAKPSKRTDAREAKFLAGLEAGDAVGFAAASAGLGRRTVYKWREADPEFAERWDEAFKVGTDALEQVARVRAVEKSDSLLMFLLKARDPERFKERTATELSGRLAVAHEEWLEKLK